MTRNRTQPWEPHFNEAETDIPMVATTPEDAARLVSACEACVVTKAPPRAEGVVLYHVVVEVDADTAEAWELTRRLRPH